jgi:hypothetical protein
VQHLEHAIEHRAVVFPLTAFLSVIAGEKIRDQFPLPVLKIKSVHPCTSADPKTAQIAQTVNFV